MFFFTGKPKVVFFVPTAVLAQQQFEKIKEHMAFAWFDKVARFFSIRPISYVSQHQITHTDLFHSKEIQVADVVVSFLMKGQLQNIPAFY